MLILDIETYKTDDQALIAYEVAGKKREDYKQSALEKLAINPHTGKVILVGMLNSSPVAGAQEVIYPEGAVVEEQNIMYQVMLGLDGKSETDILKLVWADISEELDNGGQIITYNGKSFDIPYLIRRSMICNIPVVHRRGGDNIFYPYDLIKKYSSEAHLDLFEKLNPNYGDFVSLNKWAYVMGITTDMGSKGSDVGEWFEKGEFDKIKEHCSEDLWKTFYVYERMKPWIT